jgi:hypothetical protein
VFSYDLFIIYILLIYVYNIVLPFKSSFVDVFVASGGIPTSGLDVEHVGIFVGTSLDFLFGENPLGLELGDSWTC